MTRRRATQRCLFVAAIAVFSGVLLCAAVFAHAPTVVVPLVVAACIACPMAAAYELPPALESLRHYRARGAALSKAVAELRQGMAELPETKHPHGF